MPQLVGTINLEAHARTDWSYEFPTTRDDDGNLITSANAGRMQVRDSFGTLHAEAFVNIGDDGKPIAHISRNDLLQAGQYLYDVIIESTIGFRSKRYSGNLRVLETVTEWSGLEPTNQNPNPTLARVAISYRSAVVEPIAGHRVLSTVNGNPVLADFMDTQLANSVLGLSLNAAAIGQRLAIATYGEITEVSWNWVPNLPIFLAGDGLMTQTAPTLGALLRVAYAQTAKTIFFNPGPVIIRN
jgi:hypothetical protein